MGCTAELTNVPRPTVASSQPSACSSEYAFCAVNRVTPSGRVLGAAECLSVDEALHAITLGAAGTVGLDHEIGSIECGKRADFCVLEDDPLGVDPMALKDLRVWGTVQGGRVFPAG